MPAPPTKARLKSSRILHSANKHRRENLFELFFSSVVVADEVPIFPTPRAISRKAMSIIKAKVLYSRDKLEEPEVNLDGYPNFGEFILSHLTADPSILDQVWLVNAGYDLTGVNRASCGRVHRKYGELEPLSRGVGTILAELGVGFGSIVQVRGQTLLLR